MADRTVRVRLEAVTEAYQAKMAAAGATTQGVAGAMDTLGKRGSSSLSMLSNGLIDVSGKTAAVAGGAAIAGAAILKFAQVGIDAYTRLADQVDTYQDITGSSAEESSRMVAVANALGVSTDTLATSMFRLSRNVKTNASELANYGVEVARNVDGSVDLSETLLRVSDAYNRVGGGAEGNAIAYAAFGRGAAQLIDVLERSRVELEGFWAEAERHHQILDEDDLRAAREYEIAMRELGMAFQGLAIVGAQGLVPMLSTVADGLTKVVELVDRLPGGGIGGWLEKGVKAMPGIGSVAIVLDLLGGESDEAADSAEDLAGAFETVDGAAAAVVDSVDAYSAMVDRARDSTLGLQASTDGIVSGIGTLAAGVREAAEAGDEFATSLDATSERGLQNRAAIRGVVDGVLSLAQSLREQGAAESDIANVTAAYRTQLTAVLTQLGFNQEQVARYLGVLGMIPSGVHTTITADDSQALAAIARVRAAMWELVAAFGGIFGNGNGARDNAASARAVADALGATTGVPAGGLPNFAAPAAGGAAESDAARSERQYQEQRARNERELEFERATLQERIRIAEEHRDQQRHLSDEWMQWEQRRVDAVADLAEHELKIREETAAALESIVKGQIDVARIQFDEGRLAAEQFVAVLRAEHERMVEMYGYWSEEAARIRDEIRGIFDDQASAMEDVAEAYDRAMEEAKKAVEDAMGHLNGLLDDERDIRRRLADSRAEHEERMAEIGRRFVEEQQGAIDDRKRQLSESLSIEERFVAGWANTPAALARNARAQIAAFEEWSDRLAEARARGLSDDVIDMLGLAEGPEALAQLRMFASATDAEIAEMNAAIAARAEWVNGQVNREQSDAYSTLADTLLGLAERHHAEVEALTEEFLDEQRDLKDELAAIGDDQGRSYGDAIAEGLRSSIPAIREAAEAAQRALRDADRASGGGGSGGGGGGGYEIVKGRPPGGGYTSDHGTVIIGKKKYVWHAGVASVPGAAGQEVDARLMAGERVLSVPDNRALVAAVQGMGSPQVTVAPSFTVEMYDLAGRRLTDSDVRVIVRDERGKAVSSAARAGSR